MRIDAVHHLAVELEHETKHAVRRRMLRSKIDGELAVFRLGFLHVGHGAAASSAALSSLAAMPRRKRSHDTMKRSWVPVLISSNPSWARSLHCARGPLPSLHSASARRTRPAGAAR